MSTCAEVNVDFTERKIFCEPELLRWPWKVPVTSKKVPVQHHYSSDTGDPTKYSKYPYQLQKKKKIPSKLSFSRYNIQIMGAPNLLEEAMCFKEVQGLFENSLWFGKCLQKPT